VNRLQAKELWIEAGPWTEVCRMHFAGPITGPRAKCGAIPLKSGAPGSDAEGSRIPSLHLETTTTSGASPRAMTNHEAPGSTRLAIDPLDCAVSQFGTTGQL